MSALDYVMTEAPNFISNVKWQLGSQFVEFSIEIYIEKRKYI